MAASGENTAERSAPLAPRLRRAQARINTQMKRALPAPAYRVGIRGYYELRVRAGHGPGRGRLLPDYVIIGTHRGGTTSLYWSLIKHPFVAPASRKEIHYFDYNYFRGEDWYRRHFPLHSERDAFERAHGRPFVTGEASPPYMSHPWAAERLAALMPQAKLLVSLRNPVDRAYSQFQMRRRAGQEPLASFADAVAAEEERLAPALARAQANRLDNSSDLANWSYLLRGRYAEQLERWFELFPREQFHFITLNEFAEDPQKTLDGVHEFLGLPPHRYDNFERLHGGTYDEIPADVRARLNEYFRPHNERLYELLGQDFGW